ncbi:hypothetical protein Hanom_Chr10g00956301 [Helianthus anomalus]
MLYFRCCFGNLVAASVQLSSFMSGRQIPRLSFVSCKLQYLRVPGTLIAIAAVYPVPDESGNSPGKPPWAITNGSPPKHTQNQHLYS